MELVARGHRNEKPSTATKYYHIRWSGVARLDWEAFGTIAETEATAKQLLREGETFGIEERDTSYSRRLRAKAAGHS